jgi:hypothetical protein
LPGAKKLQQLFLWLDVTGKGDKVRIIPATGKLMVELARYRRELGMTPYPLSGEPTPLLLPTGGVHSFPDMPS